MLAGAASSELIAYLTDYRGLLPRERGIVGRDVRHDVSTIKSHHSLSLLRLGGIPKTDIAIIVRDPRDVAVSGAGFFFNTENTPTPESIDHMIDMMISETKPRVRWNDQRWDQFVEHSLNRGVPFVRYIDLVEKTEETLRPILSHLSLDLDDAAMNRLITYHSFDRAKQRFQETGRSTFRAICAKASPVNTKTGSPLDRETALKASSVHSCRSSAIFEHARHASK